MARQQSRSKKQKRHTKKQSKKLRGRSIKSWRKTNTKTRHYKMRGGFTACADNTITEPGFNVPAYGKAPGLNIPDTKVALGSGNKMKIDHPMVNQ